jgi:hypothetical protein
MICFEKLRNSDVGWAVGNPERKFGWGRGVNRRELGNQSSCKL